MLTFNHTGHPLPKSVLRTIGIDLTDEGYTLLIKICWLTSVKEITRRMCTGLRSDGSKVEELPFALLHYRALVLIREGHLTMAQVFSQDADYGIATGEAVTTYNLPKTLQKAEKINQLYNQKIREYDALPDAEKIACEKELRSEGREGYGYDYDLTPKQGISFK
ncbi:MAG: hypothetical protein ACK4PR_01100 [Gammaproteobacteria bacterium]